MATAIKLPQVQETERIVLHDVSWRTYVTLLKDWQERRIWLTYDGSDLEIMSPLFEHEFYKGLIRRMIDLLTWELGIRVQSGGATTLRRKKLKKGLEADECYWIANAARVRGKRRIDLRIDPPPDLAVEIEITHSVLDRLGIYAGLRIPELWRFDGENLRAFLLQPDGKYVESEMSLSFPFLRVEALSQFLQPNDELDETDRLRLFVAWVREQNFPKQPDAD